jgi:hypothetical protein
MVAPDLELDNYIMIAVTQPLQMLCNSFSANTSFIIALFFFYPDSSPHSV